MRINQILVLTSLFSALSISFGFTANRTEWSVVPQLNPKVSLQVLMKDAQVKAIDDVLRTSEEKKTPGHENVTIVKNPLREKRFHDVESTPESSTDFIIKLITEPKPRVNRKEKITKSSAKESSVNGPLNVILLLIDDLHENEQPILEDRHIFPVREFLESCPKYSAAVPPSSEMLDCDCDELLRSNVASLLSWAQHVKEMSTSALYEMPTVYSRQVEIDTRSFTSPRTRQIDRQLHDSWQLNDDSSDGEAGTSKSSELPPIPIETHDLILAGTDNDAGTEETSSLWHVSNILTRLRRAFFHTLLGSFSSPHEVSVVPNKRRPVFAVPGRRYSDFYELASRTLAELATIPNERGYILVATTTDATDELPGALELLRRYVSPSNTLVIVTSTCPHEKSRLVPFYARGPGSDSLFSNITKTLRELPNAIRTVINEKDCQEFSGNCHEVPKFEEPVESSLKIGGPISMYDEIIEPRGRFAREDKPENKTQELPKKTEKDLKETASENKKINETKQTPVETIKKKNEKSESKDIPDDVNIKVRMGDDTTATNSQEIVSHTIIIFVTVVIFTITYTLQY